MPSYNNLRGERILELALDRACGYQISANAIEDECVSLKSRFSREQVAVLTRKEMIFGGIISLLGTLITHFLPDPNPSFYHYFLDSFSKEEYYYFYRVVQDSLEVSVNR